MRLVTSTKYLISMLAAGGAVLLLGGSALAADGSHVPSVEASETSSVSNLETSQFQPTHESEVTPTPVVAGQSAIPSAVTAGISQASLTASTGTQSLSQPGASAGLVDTTNVSSKVSAPMSAALVPVSPLPSNAADAHVVPVAQPLAISSGSLAVPEVPAQVPTVTPSQVPQSVVSNSQILFIQPAIIGHSPQANIDLASLIPTAPVSSHLPLPAKSTGLFSNLTAGLASTIVPAAITLFTYAAIPAVPVSSAAPKLIGLLAALVVFSAARWIHQGGFQAAARSSLGSNNSFVTPLTLSYDPSPMTVHSSFLLAPGSKLVQSTFCNFQRKGIVV